MTLSEFQKINAQRAARWHGGGIHRWNALEWAGAMCGEAGEAANACKKLKRLEDDIPSINSEPGHNFEKAEDAKLKIGKECADTIIYAFLLMSVVGIDADYMIQKVFNQKSEDYGFPERL